ncbi:very-long-chain (3R)-3-hydroxyacyl-CoA dehydratase [Chrysoperla carnea]|uniref:very-long-chain (3R)-3-hydroxyacyl-CoA dehydratase n=1 Tax=Chrysoperla carnea TaxID=189513 RepID=UPI001D06A820|nr:very-long-chain (3R)-3-hydroxyacyl-CoA dehydratase [Chrysoperla carnea]
MPEVYSPFVYWSQSEGNITLKVDLKDVKDPNISLEPKRLQFAARGHGARGAHNYEFSLDFHSEVNPEESTYKVIDSKVDFAIKKSKLGWWPRLTGRPQKPAWLKIDFDRWQTENDDINDDEVRDVRQDYPEMFDKVQKDELGYRKEDMKKVYLIFYNLCQFIGFAYIFTVMAIRYFRDGPDSMPGTYAAVGNAIKFVQLIQFLEVMHPMFGYTKGSPFPAFLQTGGRAVILFCMIEAEPRMQEKPVIFYLFFVWTLIELVRYPYYISQLYNKDIGFLTWLRYTIWIPLYPLGIVCEGVIILRNIPYFEETQKFTVSLPNTYNFAFHFPTVMRLYLLIFIIPVMYALMSHMYKARVKKLGPKSWQKKFA